MKKRRKNLTVRAMANYFGVNSSYIGKLKLEGMPMISTEAAEAWRNERGQRMGTRTKAEEEAAPEAIVEQPAPIPDDPTEYHPELLGIDLTGLERELQTAQRMVQIAGKRVEEARNNSKFEALIGQRQTIYNKANENYDRMEKSVRKEKVARGELLTVDQAKIQINKLHVPTVTLLRKLPRTVASKVAPGNEVTAEKILSEAIEELISELRRSLQGEPDPDFHLTVFKAVILHDHGAAKLIELLEAAKAEVIAETSEEAPK